MSDSEKKQGSEGRERSREWQPNPVVLVGITALVIAYYAVTEDLSAAQICRLLLFFGSATGLALGIHLMPERAGIWAVRVLFAVWVVLSVALALFFWRPELLVYLLGG